MPPYAHSARPKRGIPTQEYADHIRAVFREAGERARRAAKYSTRFGAILESAVEHAGLWHDLGKLDPANQAVLGSVSRDRLPINHCDAGVAQLMREAEATGSLSRLLAAVMVFAHHIGLPNCASEWERPAGQGLRDEKLGPEGVPLYLRTDAALDELVRHHRKVLPTEKAIESNAADWSFPPLFRVALSCLVDADHADTAFHYRDAPLFDDPPLRAAERLASLDQYVRDLGKDKIDSRNKLRQEVYIACRDANTVTPLIECDSPVGTGKTTAVMAHLLRAAVDKNLRRIIVVQPFTNIINQSIKVYRSCLMLRGEDPNEIVVPHHHKAEFDSVHARQFTALWHAPVVVTTAVQFFETLADNRPAGLRKLHQLPGSAVFIDESHAALPAKLWPRAWDWLKQLTRDWGCHVVLGSGSLNRVWQLPEVDPETPYLPPLIHPTIGAAAADAEKDRVSFKTRDEPLRLSELADWVADHVGPRLLIVNTVQTAAALARYMATKFGRCKVEHLSTALIPDDREKTLKIVRVRLDPIKGDTNWTLVATSCVEAGVDISFRVGFRERAGLNSLLQIAGRVNRGSEFGSADVWDFRLAAGELVASNPGVKDAAEVLGQFFAMNRVSPDACTDALKMEIRMKYAADLNAELAKAENAMDFPEVEKCFRVIDEETVAVVVDKKIIDNLMQARKMTWQDLQGGSVNLYRKRAEKFQLPVNEFKAFPGLYRWNREYDEFLGYMEGGLKWLEDPSTPSTDVFIW